MKEINIAKTIMNKRKEKQITQDDLASYIGVSKASVSKWETGQSYPDITLLPQLAAYFNISIDDLMGYQPQMTMESIRLLYHELSNDFAVKPFDEVVSRCREIAKKYFSCFPLLFHMGTLLVNYSTLANDKEKSDSILTEAKEWFVQVKEQRDDLDLAKQALYLEAACAHILGNPKEVIELLSETSSHQTSTEALLAAAYQATGKGKEAKTILQIGIYQQILSLFGLFPAYLSLCAEDAGRLEQAYQRIEALTEAFRMKELHPALLFNVYLAASQGFLASNSTDKALGALENYARLATGKIYPLQLHGDDFFDLIDSWLDTLILGIEPPRNEQAINQSIADAITMNPAFSVLEGEPRFQIIVNKLKGGM